MNSKWQNSTCIVTFTLVPVRQLKFCELCYAIGFLVSQRIEVRASYWNIFEKVPQGTKINANLSVFLLMEPEGTWLRRWFDTPIIIWQMFPGFIVFPPFFLKQNMWYSARKRCNVSLHFKGGLGVVSNLQDYIARISSHRRPIISLH